MGYNSGIWSLSHGCCSTDQWTFILAASVYLLFDLIFWRCPFMRPFKVLAVLVHELCHATACWLTCGRVEGLEAHLNEGGVTKYRGGCQTLITPAGYLGGAFWGGLCIVASSYLPSTYGAAAVIIVALLIALVKADNCTLRVTAITFIALIVVFAALSALRVVALLQFVTLFLGIIVCVFSVYDIYDDTIRRTVAESDASACFEMYPCCPPVGWGVLWALVGLAFFVGSIYLAFVSFDWQNSGNSVTDVPHFGRR